MGVVANLEAHWIPGSTISSVNGKTLGLRSHFPGFSSDFSDATEYGAHLVDLLFCGCEQAYQEHELSNLAKLVLENFLNSQAYGLLTF